MSSMIFFRISQVFKAQGIGGVVSAVLRRLAALRASSFPECRNIVRGRIGLEVGGPSPIFAPGGLLPIYRSSERIDNCNFAADTIFANSQLLNASAREQQGASDCREAHAFNAGRNAGRVYFGEGSDLRAIASETYDFVLSSHMLEHSANPLRALGEWRRVLKTDGGLILVLPHKDGTFDHKRPVTTMEHIVSDFERNMGEDDLTHIPEVIELHDLSRDFGVTSAAFRDRVQKNPQIRSVHHHVFDTFLAARLVNRAGFALVAMEALRPYHILIVARKSTANVPSESELRAAWLSVLRKSPFPSDRSQ